MANIICTKIFANEKREFRKFLMAAGFNGFELAISSDEVYLTITFENPASVMNFKLRGIENDYKHFRSNVYYYDLDQSWDDEADNYFGDDDVH